MPVDFKPCRYILHIFNKDKTLNLLEADNEDLHSSSFHYSVVLYLPQLFLNILLEKSRSLNREQRPFLEVLVPPLEGLVQLDFNF